MATAAQAYAIVASATGLNPNTVDRTARALRETGRGLWVVGGPGGGKNAAQVELSHLSNLLRGLAGPLPSDAPEALERLQNLTATFRQLPPLDEERYRVVERNFCLMDGPGEEGFDQWLGRCLTNLAGLAPNERRELLQNHDVRDADLAFSPYDQRIRIEWGGDEFQGRRALVFANAAALTPDHKVVDPPKARRILVLPLTALIEAARLLAGSAPNLSRPGVR
jgi:hypothetical protein